MKKYIFVCLLCLVLIMLTLSGCVPSKWSENHPNAFPDTIWATTDNLVIIEIDNFSDGYKRGYINTGNETLEVFFSLPTRPDVCVKTKEQIEANNGECLESWEAQTPEKDKFIIKVKKTTFFNIGDVLTFYKVGENTNNDNHISRDDAEEKVQDVIPQKEYVQTAHFSRKETINNNACFVFYVSALSWERLGDDWVHKPVITHWVYIDAVTGEVYEVIDAGNTVYATQEDFLTHGINTGQSR